MESPLLLEVFGYWQFAVCLFAGLGLLGIWWHIGRKKGDFGQVWLALSVFCWSASGLVEVYFSNQPSENGFYLAAARSILSLFNSLFILLALPWFRNLPTWLSPLVKHRFWPLIVGLPFLFSLLPTLSGLLTGTRSSFIGELDVYYALLTLLFLSAVLWTSFTKRRLPVLAWLSVVCALVTLVAQLYKFSLEPSGLILFSAIFKTNLIMLFFALALSWVKELSEAAVLPDENQLSLQLVRVPPGEGGKAQQKLRLSGLANRSGAVDCTLSPANLELMKCFIDRRLAEAGNDGGWLEIKPKFGARNGKVYDINDHNQLKRLVQSLADSLYGKDNWTKELHFQPLKQALFEASPTQDRRLRLRPTAERIVTDK